MRRVVRTSLVSFLFAGASLLGACGGGGVNVDKTCSDVCAKQVSCGDQQDQASCEAGCKQMIPKLLDKFVSTSTDCVLSHTCEELDNNVCQNVGQEYCTTDLHSFAEKVRKRQVVDCSGGSQSDVDACVQQISADLLSGLLQCYKTSALDDYANCLVRLPCDASDDDRNACAESELGVTFSK